MTAPIGYYNAAEPQSVESFAQSYVAIVHSPDLAKEFIASFPGPKQIITYNEMMVHLNKILLGNEKPRPPVFGRCR